MKKTIICAFALVLTSLTAFSQSAPSGSASAANGADKNFHFGLNVTPGFYFLSTQSPNAANSGSLGFGYGVNLEFYFSQNYGFVTGLEMTSFHANYTNTVSNNTNPFQDSTTAHQVKLQYLEIPLMFKFRTLPIGLIKYFGIVGLNPGIRLKSTDDYTVTGGEHPLSPPSVNGADANSETSIIRLSYVIGLGLEYNLAGTTSVQGYISYDAGFLNMNSSGGSVQTKGITLTVGILF